MRTRKIIAVSIVPTSGRDSIPNHGEHFIFKERRVLLLHANDHILSAETEDNLKVNIYFN
jgi:hypothetical protein